MKVSIKFHLENVMKGKLSFRFLSKILVLVGCIVSLGIGFTLYREDELTRVSEHEHWLAKEVMVNESWDTMVKEQVLELDDSKISYPKLIAGGTTEQLARWNDLILQDVDKIVAIYGLKRGDSQLVDEPSTRDFLDIIVTMKYEITLYQPRYLSIRYLVDSYYSEGPYPVTSIYTTNLDLLKNQRLVMGDIINNDTPIIMDAMNWTITTNGIEKDIRQEIKDYFAGLGVATLNRGIQSTDIIGSDNLLGIFTYLTPSRFGIAVSVPNYLGDYVLLEQDYKDLSQILKINLP